MIKNEYAVTWKLFKTWLIENKLKGIRLVFFIFWNIFTILALISNFITGFSMFYIFVALYCIYRAFFRDYIFTKKQYNQLAKINGGNDWIRTITIYDTETYVKEGVAEYKYNNADVINVIEKGDKILLVMNNNMVIRLYKSAFIEGGWNECKEKFVK